MREAPAEGYNYIFGLKSSNMSTADAADFAIKKPPQGRFFLWCRLVD